MDPWLVLQLADSAFPVGGFAHSGGLEAAFQLGELEGDGAVGRFLHDGLWQVGHGTLPFVAAAHDAVTASQAAGAISFDVTLRVLELRCDAFLQNPVANRASLAQGRAFASTCARVFGGPSLEAIHAHARDPAARPHHGPIVGGTMACLGMDRRQTLEVFLHLTLRGLASAAVRLGVLGPLEAQRTHRDLSAVLARVVEACEGISPEDAAQTAPLADLWSSFQDDLYSRLFQS